MFKPLGPFVGVWSDKRVGLATPTQIIFVDESTIQWVPDDKVIRGEFVGYGTLGAKSSVKVKVERWLVLRGTTFKVGITGKQVNPDRSWGLDTQSIGHWEFKCGSSLDFTTDTVKFTVTGQGMLVIRYSPSEVGLSMGVADLRLMLVRA